MASGVIIINGLYCQTEIQSSHVSVVDNCMQNAHHCPSNSSCVNSVGSYTCVCNEGFTKVQGKAKCGEWQDHISFTIILKFVWSDSLICQLIAWMDISDIICSHCYRRELLCVVVELLLCFKGAILNHGWSLGPKD